MNNKNLIMITIVLSFAVAAVLHSFVKPSPQNNYNYLSQGESKYNENNENNGVKEVESKVPNIVLIGVDGDKTRADAILLFNFDAETKKINLLSFARDTRVLVRGEFAKINALKGMGGEKLILKAVQQITGLDVNYYVTFDFKGFREIIDTLGGVIYDVPFDMIYDDPEQNLHIDLKKGRQLLDGKKSEEFVRYRKGNNPNEGYIDGDIGRIAAQQKFFKEMLLQKMDIRYFTKVDDLITIIKKNLKTNMGMDEMKKYAVYIPDMRTENVKTFILPGESKYMDGLWYYICDRDKTRELVWNNFAR